MNQDYLAITHGIAVSVRPFYLDDQSRPDESHFLWVYRVRIENRGSVPVQLLKRSWEITDARGRVQRVHGDGVVGEQPVIPPGVTYEYQSGTPLATPSGVMAGVYHMVETESRQNFDVTIPAFSLDSPHQSGSVH
jgi:ApaG protein